MSEESRPHSAGQVSLDSLVQSWRKSYTVIVRCIYNSWGFLDTRVFTFLRRETLLHLQWFGLTKIWSQYISFHTYLLITLNNFLRKWLTVFSVIWPPQIEMSRVGLGHMMLFISSWTIVSLNWSTFHVQTLFAECPMKPTRHCQHTFQDCGKICENKNIPCDHLMIPHIVKG